DPGRCATPCSHSTRPRAAPPAVSTLCWIEAMANTGRTDRAAGAGVMCPDAALDESGKVVLDHVYNQRDPRAYFRVLRELSYRIPDAAQAVIRRLLPVLARARKRDRL